MTRDSARHSLTDDFVTAIREERVLRVTGKDGLCVVEIVTAVCTGQRARVPQT